MRIGWIGTRELAAGAKAAQVLAQVHRVLGHEGGVEVVGQLEVLLADHQRGGRLGADDRVAVADRVAQDAQVRQRQVARVIDVAGDQCGHPRVALAGGDEDIDLGLMEDGHDRLGQLLVEVVGEDIDEVGDARARRVRPRLRHPPPRGPPHERRAMCPRETALL